MKGVWGFLVSSLFSSLLFTPFYFQLAVAESAVIRVPQDYPTIKQAVDAAHAGDTIIVSEGMYPEGQISIAKPNLTLKADGAVAIDGLHQEWVFCVTADNVTIQGFTHKLIDTWDNGYPSGGNYWSNYDGKDMYRGFYQNVTGCDGIGDTPFIISVDTQDCYPLMAPWRPLLGDVNGDGTVNIQDIVQAAIAYGSRQGDPNWNPFAGLSPPWRIINILDLVTATANYGKET